MSEDNGEANANDESASDPGDLPVVRTEGFRKYYATRTMAQTTEFDVRLMILNEKMGDEEEEFYIGESMVILTPVAAKELMNRLRSVVRAWEKERGKIPKRPSTTLYTRLSVEE